MFTQTYAKFCVVCKPAARIGQDNDIDRRNLTAPERFSHYSPDTISVNSVFKFFFCHGHTQSGHTLAVLTVQQCPVFIRSAIVALEHAGKLLRPQQTSLTPEIVVAADSGQNTLMLELHSRANPSDYADSRRLPFARLARMTALPPRVAMRARNPWVRLRRKLLGWKVCFIAGYQ